MLICLKSLLLILIWDLIWFKSIWTQSTVSRPGLSSYKKWLIFCRSDNYGFASNEENEFNEFQREFTNDSNNVEFQAQIGPDEIDYNFQQDHNFFEPDEYPNSEFDM